MGKCVQECAEDKREMAAAGRQLRRHQSALRASRNACPYIFTLYGPIPLTCSRAVRRPGRNGR